MPPRKIMKNSQKKLPKMIVAESESDSDSVRSLVVEKDVAEYSHDPFVFKNRQGMFILVINGVEYRRRYNGFMCYSCQHIFNVKNMVEVPFEGLAIGIEEARIGHKIGCKVIKEKHPLEFRDKLFLQHYGGKCYDATEDVVPVYNTKHNDPKNAQKPKKLNSPLLKDNDEIITGQMDGMNISGSSKINKDVINEGMDVRPAGAQNDQNGNQSEESEETAVSTSSGDSSLTTSSYSSWSNRDASYAPTASSPDSSFAWGEIIHGE